MGGGGGGGGGGVVIGGGGGGGGGLGVGPPPPPVMVTSAQFWNCSPEIPFQLEVCQTYWIVHLVQVTPAGSVNVNEAVVHGC